MSEQSELIRFKCANHHHKSIRLNTHFKWSNPTALSSNILIKPLELRLNPKLAEHSHEGESEFTTFHNLLHHRVQHNFIITNQIQYLT